MATLLETIHRYAEDREIDYIPARTIAEEWGVELRNESDLMEWKETIDNYLKTFEEDAFNRIVEIVEQNRKGE